MIEASKLKAGMTFETADGKLIRVLEASHHKPGKGNTMMSVLVLLLTQATVQKKNSNKLLSKLFQLNTCTKWMKLPTS